MKNSAIRWIVIGLMLCAMALLISSPALAEVNPLPLDMLTPGGRLDLHPSQGGRTGAEDSSLCLQNPGMGPHRRGRAGLRL